MEHRPAFGKVKVTADSEGRETDQKQSKVNLNLYLNLKNI